MTEVTFIFSYANNVQTELTRLYKEGWVVTHLANAEAARVYVVLERET